MALPLARPTIAVTYRCNEHHTEVRFWRADLPIDRYVTCSVCGWPAVIGVDEMERHDKLHDGLRQRLVT